jgi:diguanylate cyclase (GGDEF)-like protein
MGRRFAKSLRLRALVSLLFAIAGAPGQFRGQRLPELTTVRAIRSLSPDQAGQARPVRLRGVVTVVSGWKSSFFFQDATSGIFVDRTNDFPQLKPGQFVEVHGVTAPGNFAPVVKTNNVTVLGTGKMPPARFLGLDKLAGGKQDSQWLALRGIVRSAVIEPSWGRLVLFLNLDIGAGNMIKVRVHDFWEAAWHRLPGATISVRGVCGTVFNDKRQFADLRLFVSSLEEVKVERPAPADPFDLPLRPLGRMLQFGDAGGFIQRVKVSGVVTYTQPGQGLYLQDGALGVYVQSRQAAPIALGSRLEVVGYPATGRYSATLDDALLRVVGMAHPLAGLVQTAAVMIVEKNGIPAAPYDSVLVQLKGRLIEEVPGPDEEVLLFQDGTSFFFTARLPRSGPKRHVLAPGSLVSITGICLAKADSEHDARSFEILLRSPTDLVVLKNASWWTAAHAWSVVAILLLIVLGLVGWLAILGRQASLRVLAMTDHLTGLYNRRGFLLFAEHQWRLALRKKMAVVLFYIDLDHFKEINDSRGHKEGDLALQEVAAVLRECFRKTDLIGRLGGDEFAVTAVDTAPHSLAQLEQRLEKTLQQSNQKSNRAFQLSLSVGVLSCDDSLKASSIEDLLARADVLMYQQKSVRKQRTSATGPITVVL